MNLEYFKQGFRFKVEKYNTMSSFICIKCENQCVFKSRPDKDELFGAKCDSCSRFICKICANLTTSEAQAVALVSRTLIFHCPECKTHITTPNRRSQEREKFIRRNGYIKK